MGWSGDRWDGLGTDEMVWGLMGWSQERYVLMPKLAWSGDRWDGLGTDRMVWGQMRWSGDR